MSVAGYTCHAGHDKDKTMTVLAQKCYRFASKYQLAVPGSVEVGKSEWLVSCSEEKGHAGLLLWTAGLPLFGFHTDSVPPCVREISAVCCILSNSLWLQIIFTSSWIVNHSNKKQMCYLCVIILSIMRFQRACRVGAQFLPRGQVDKKHTPHTHSTYSVIKLDVILLIK